MGFVKDQPLSSLTAANIDVETLPMLGLDPDVRDCVVLTKRVQSELYHKYLCNGADSRDGAHETWSSKPFAVAQAAGNLRSNESESDCHQVGELGLDGRAVNGVHGPTLLGDLATIIASYDTTMGYSSNSLSGWFNSIALHFRENDLVQSWLWSLSGITTEPQSLGGDYGEQPPSDIALPTALSRVIAPVPLATYPQTRQEDTTRIPLSSVPSEMVGGSRSIVRLHPTCASPTLPGGTSSRSYMAQEAAGKLVPRRRGVV